jgi:hypothetical protein
LVLKFEPVACGQRQTDDVFGLEAAQGQRGNEGRIEQAQRELAPLAG